MANTSYTEVRVSLLPIVASSRVPGKSMTHTLKVKICLLCSHVYTDWM